MAAHQYQWLLVHDRTAQVISSHRTPAAAERALEARHRRVRTFLNRPGLHAGIRADQYDTVSIVVVETYPYESDELPGWTRRPQVPGRQSHDAP